MNYPSNWFADIFMPNKSEWYRNTALLQAEQDFNANQAQITREYNAEQAQLQRDFEERMSNTAYQRAFDDMKKSGLNPYLMYSQGGASTPTGSTAQAQSATSTSKRVSQNNSFGELIGSLAKTTASAMAIALRYGLI